MAAFVRDCDELECVSPKNRCEEKDMLRKLNERLSCYINRLRKLEKENEDLKREDAKPSGSTSQTETVCEQLTKVRKDFESKLHSARCAAERCADENANLLKERNEILCRLKEEEAAQKRAEQDAEKMRLTLRFERDLHRQELKEICKQSKLNNQRHQIQISERYKAQLNDSLNTLRGQLEDQLRLNHMNFDNQMKSLHGSVIGVDAGGAAITSIVSAQGAAIATHIQIANITAQLKECEITVGNLELQIKWWDKVLLDDKCQMEHLTKIIKELCEKYQKLLDDKVKIQCELDAYNTMLQCEENRLKLTHMCDAVAQEAAKRANNKDVDKECARFGGKNEKDDKDDKKKFDIEIDYHPEQN